MTNIENFKFGVEIEFTGEYTQVVAERMAQYLVGQNITVAREGYNHSTRSYWKVITDASVTTSGYDYRTGSGFGGEIVSPVLQGSAGLAELSKILEALNSIETVKVDRRCGIHVHLSWDGMTVKWVQNVVRRYAQFETAIDGWMARSRRSNNSRWCQSMADVVSRICGYNGSNTRELARMVGRYYKVNVTSLATHGTIEFRQHQGSTEYAKIANWIKFLMAFVTESQNLTTEALAKTNYRRQEGKAYGEIREQFEAQGYELRYAGRKWKLFDANGNHIDTKMTTELDAMYAGIGRRLNQNFADWFNGIVAPTTTEDNVFKGVDAETKTFLEARIAHFA